MIFQKLQLFWEFVLAKPQIACQSKAQFAFTKIFPSRWLWWPPQVTQIGLLTSSCHWASGQLGPPLHHVAKGASMPTCTFCNPLGQRLGGWGEGDRQVCWPRPSKGAVVGQHTMVPLENSRAKGMCQNSLRPISMGIYSSITTSPTVSTALAIPTKPSMPCIRVDTFVL